MTEQPPSSGPRRILILFAHPALHKSRVHRRLADAARAVPGVTFHDLYQVYPELDIDVAHEQELLLEHDMIIMQFPMYWYSTPAMLKEWQDLVLEHGWAYGSKGTMLADKELMLALSSGGPEAAYVPGGFNNHTARQLLMPIELTARLCRMRYRPPFIVHGTHRLDEAEIETAAGEYGRVLEALCSREIDLDAVDAAPRMNADLDAIVAAKSTS